MSEGILILAGTVESDPLDVSETDPHRTRCSFGVRTTPASKGHGDREPFVTTVMAFREIASDVLDKVREGDRVIVQGRLGSHRGRPLLYAVLVGLDLRSLSPGRAAEPPLDEWSAEEAARRAHARELAGRA
jgi:hypothetical protein